MRAPGAPKWLFWEFRTWEMGGWEGCWPGESQPGVWAPPGLVSAGSQAGREPALSMLAPRLFSGKVSMKQINSPFWG